MALADARHGDTQHQVVAQLRSLENMMTCVLWAQLPMGLLNFSRDAGKPSREGKYSRAEHRYTWPIRKEMAKCPNIRF